MTAVKTFKESKWVEEKLREGGRDSDVGGDNEEPCCDGSWNTKTDVEKRERTER